MSEAEYVANDMARFAIERNLITIGEALARIRSTERSIADLISTSEEVVGMRNSMVHEYKKTDDVAVWQTVTVFLPALVEEVEAILDAQS